MQIAGIRMPIWLIILYVLSLAVILLWPFAAFFTLGFGFDAPGSAQNPQVWTMVIAVLSYPLLPLIGVPASYLVYRKSRGALAYILAGVGALPLLAVVLGLIGMTVMNVVFLLRGPSF
jgi:hypothetical protein